MPSQVPPSPPPPDVDTAAAPVAATDAAPSAPAAAAPVAAAPSIPPFIATAQKERARRAKAAQAAKDAVLLRKYFARWRAETPHVVEDAEEATPPPAADPSVMHIDVHVDPAGEEEMDVEPSIEDRAVACVAAAAAEAAISRRALKEDVNKKARAHIPDEGTMMDRVELASKHVYDVDLREFQRDVLASMFDHRNLKQLVVARTGAGKTHIMRMVSAVLQGIHLYMCPLLSLMADIAKKFREGSDAFGAIEVFNLDELASRCATTRNRILERLAAMKTSSTTTIILLASPQFLCNHKEFVDVLLKKCLPNKTLRSIMIDEAHLWAEHGMTFRPEIRILGETLLKPIYQRRDNSIFFLAGTGTMSECNLKGFTTLTSIAFKADARTWSKSEEFCQDYIKMQIQVGSDYTKALDKTVTCIDKDSGDGACFIFANSKGLTHRIVEKLEAKLDDVETDADVIHIHGSQSKEEKFGFISIFVGVIKVLGYFPKLFVATSAGDLGIDHEVLLVLGQSHESVSGIVVQ